MSIAHAQRQTELYQQIWSEDRSYGTALRDVRDTVEHRILPHMRRVYGGNNFTVVDFGAGDGRFLEELNGRVGPWTLMAGLDVYEPECKPRGVRWFKQVMWEPLDTKFDYAISTDALEHLPPSMVQPTLRNIAESASHGFLRISLIEDRYGTERGLHLHESVYPACTWLTMLRIVGITVTSYRLYLENENERALEVYF